MKKTVNYLKTIFSGMDEIELEKSCFWECGRELSKYSIRELNFIHELLQENYGNLVVFSLRNLRFMKLFYEKYKEYPSIISDYPNVTWYMHIIIMKRCRIMEDCIYFLSLSQLNHYTSCQLERTIIRLNGKKPKNNDIIKRE